MSKLNYLAKVLAALILHSYQNYALCFTYRFPLFHSRPMEWSEEHVLFLREMVARNVFGTKKGSPAPGLAWEAIVDSLNEIHSPKFQLKDKKAVRERWNLLREKFSKKMSEEEKASGISVEELMEKESLIEELVDREDTIHAKAESASKQQLKDETAEDIRKKAMERLKETKKRNSDEGGASPKRRKSRRAEPLVDFLREKAAALRVKQQEQESQQQMIKNMILQQQEMNNAFLTVVKKLLDK